MQLVEAAITGTDDVIAAGKHPVFGGNELWTPIAGRDDVISCM